VSGTKLFLATLGVGLLAVVVWWFGRDTTPRLSDRGYQYATALYSGCNQRDATKLETLARRIAEDYDRQTLTPAEKAHLNQIIHTGLDGDWVSASLGARELMLAQVERP